MGDHRGIHIQESAVGSAIVSGDGNVVNVIYQVIQQSELETVGTSTKFGPNPYRGLAAFTEKDSDRYFGREAQIDRLWEEFQTLVERSGGPRLLTVLGPSGCGKSSLVRAGLIPALAQRPLLGKKRMRVAVMVPGEHPLESLANVLAKAVTPDRMPIDKSDEFDRKLAKPSTSGEYNGLRRITALMPEIRDSPLVLLVDQFEEIYTNEPRGTTPEEQNRRERFIQERTAFIENLLCAAKDSSGNLSVILTLRSDFLGETQRHPDLNQAISHRGVIVPAMTAAELARAIAEPAKRAGHPLEDVLVDRMVQDMAGQEGALPLLQFALTKLWEDLSQESLQGRSPLQVYLDIGGIGGAVADRADKIFDGLKDAGSSKVDRQAIAQRIFLSLVQPGRENNQVTRRRIKVKDLATRQITLEQVREVIHEFSKENARLITLSTVEGEVTAEVTHEALFETWQRFKDWISDRWDDIRLQQRLEAAATYWDEQGRPAGLLWRSPDLDLLRTFVRTANPDLSPCCLNFFRASERAERQQLLLRGTGIGALAFLAAGMTWFGIQSRRAEQLALARQLATQAEQLADQPRAIFQEAGALLAIHAFHIVSPMRQERGTINQALRRSAAQPSQIILTHNDRVTAVAFSKDSQRIATASFDGTARVWSAVTGEEIATIHHDDWVTVVTFSEDDQRVATASDDGTAQLTDAVTGEMIGILTHKDVVLDVTFSRDGQRIATASRDGTAKVWDAITGEVVAILTTNASVLAIAFSGDGRRVATASGDGIARVWDTVTGEVIASVPHDGVVRTVTFSDDSQWIATASDDGTARVWDALTGEEIATITHDDWVTDVTFSDDGQQVATASKDGTAKVVDASTGEVIAILKHDQWVNAVIFSGDGQWVATSSLDSTARVWDAVTGDVIVTLPHDSVVRAVAFSGDGQRIATSSDDGTARVRDLTMSDVIATLQHEGQVISVTFSGDEQLVATASVDGTARVWNSVTGEVNATLTHNDIVWAVTFSKDGQQVATASRDGTARVWDAVTGDLIVILPHNGRVRAVTFSGDGQRVATASDDGTARVWDALTGGIITTLPHDGRVRAVTFSEDGQQVATASGDGTARVWDAATGDVIANLTHDGVVTAVTFSGNGQQVATASGDLTARVWDAATGDTIAILTHENLVTSVTFSRDGRRVTTASLDGTARVWDAATGDVITSLNHGAGIETITFSGDGKYVATAGGDGIARVWDAATGDVIAILTHDDAVRAVTFGGDGQRVVATASDDGTARIYWLGSKDLAEQICQRHYRNFSAIEWRNYVQQDLRQYRLTCPNLPVHPTVVTAAHELAREGNVRQSTALLRHLLRISQAAGHDLDLDPATEEIAQTPRAVALRYSAVHLVREATTLARNGEIARATRRFQQALDRDPEIDLNPATDTLDQDPAAVAQSLANPDN